MGDADGVVVIKTILDNSKFDDDIEDLENKSGKLGDKIKNIINNQLKRSLSLGKNIGNTFTRLISIIGRLSAKIINMGLLIGGMTAGLMIFQKIFQKVGENEQIKANLDYIKYMLTTALTPVIEKVANIVEKIINFLYRILQYVRYIIHAWTGKDIFENASIENYSKSLQGANKNAKELQKTLTGFDKINKLDANGGVQSSGIGGATLPKFDDVPIPGWVEWIGNNGDKVLQIILGIAGAMLALKLHLGKIKALGIGLVIAGIVKSIQGVLKYIKDPSWKNFGEILEGIGIAVIGLGIIFSSLPLAIGGAILLILGIIASFWDDIKDFLNNLVQNIYKTGDKIMDYLEDKFGIFGIMLGTVVQNAVGIVTSAINSIMEMFDGLFIEVKDILDGIVKIFQGDFAGGLLSIGKGIVNALIGFINGLIEGINLILSPARALIVAFGKITGQDWNMSDVKIPTIPKLAVGGIINFPGKGVALPGAIGGEKSREGVLPLTDEAVMSQLGEEIGRHVHINANITLEIERRVLARIMKEIKSDSAFLTNGG